mmetsp:Transcript_14717/g.62110  ORF Transcript_14717/g.62110 Transcript_14717/m.62110 type:complete len:251 (+) Transcript_14717:435-1187(+)
MLDRIGRRRSAEARAPAPRAQTLLTILSTRNTHDEVLNESSLITTSLRAGVPPDPAPRVSARRRLPPRLASPPHLRRRRRSRMTVHHGKRRRAPTDHAAVIPRFGRRGKQRNAVLAVPVRGVRGSEPSTRARAESAAQGRARHRSDAPRPRRSEQRGNVAQAHGVFACIAVGDVVAARTVVLRERAVRAAFRFLHGRRRRALALEEEVFVLGHVAHLVRARADEFVRHERDFERRHALERQVLRQTRQRR